MNQTLLPMIMCDNIRMISVTFDKTDSDDPGPAPQAYSFMTSDETIQPDDICLVEDGRGNLRTVRVLDVDVIPPTNQSIEYKFIVCKVDFTSFEANKALAKKLIDTHSSEQFKRWRTTMRENLALAPPSADLEQAGALPA